MKNKSLIIIGVLMIIIAIIIVVFVELNHPEGNPSINVSKNMTEN